jgi:hypothetical protein
MRDYADAVDSDGHPICRYEGRNRNLFGQRAAEKTSADSYIARTSVETAKSFRKVSLQA